MKIRNLPIERQAEFYKRVFQLFMILSILMSFYVIGVAMNFIAVTKNGGRMPALFYDWHYEDETHFTYQNKSEVNYWYLTDIIPIPYGKASIGDALLFASVIGMLLNLFFYAKWQIHFRKTGTK
jgi:hypothetical protein